MAQDKAVNTEKYAGPGKLSSAIGSTFLWSIPASIVMGISTLPLIKGTFDALSSAVFTAPKILRDSKAENFFELAKDTIEAAPKIKGKGWAIAGAGTSIAMVIYGAVSGWLKAGKAKEQFESLKLEVAVKDTEIEGLHTQVGGLHQEAQAHRAGFAERHAKKEHASHAEKASGHHSENASHADSVRVSRHESEHAEQAI